MRLNTSLRLRLAAGATLVLLSAQSAQALPSGPGSPIVAGGTAPVISGGGNTLTVDINATRTIIDWGSFNIGAGENVTFVFDQRNQIALNRTTGPVTIDGALTARTGGAVGGNIWIYSPAGIAFGANTRVDVGGLLATSAAVNQGSFLTVGNLNLPFTGSGNGGHVTIAGGAQFNAVGHLAFVAPRVTSGAGAVVNAGDLGTAAYGGVDSYEIQFIPIGNNDLAFFTFLVPNAAAGTAQTEALNLAGQTTGANVYLLAMSRAALTSQLINAPGLLVGQSSVNNYGQVTITTGRNILLGQVNAETSQVAGVTTASVSIGEINAGGNVNVYLTGTGSIGNLSATRIRAGQGLLIAAHDINIPGGTSSGDRGILARNTFIDTAGTVNIGAMTSNTDINIQRGAAQTGRTTSQHMLTVTSANVGRDFFVFNAQTVNIGSITAANQSQVFSNGNVAIGTLNTNGYTRVSSNQFITLNTVNGVDLDLRSAGGITASSLIGRTSTSIGTAGPADIATITSPTLSLNAVSARIGNVAISGDATLRVVSMDLLNSFTATNLTIEGVSGRFILGGSDVLGLNNNEFQRIRVTNSLNLYAGLQAPTVNVPIPTYGTFFVDDLTLDPTRVPRLNVYARNGQEVLVRGRIEVVGPNGSLRIGDPAADSLWTPRKISILGGLGTAQGDPLAGFTNVRAFESVALHATNDILMGSQRFLDLIGDLPPAQIDIGRGVPLGVAAQGDEIGKLFLVAGSVTLTANDRIVQQNTGVFGFEGGLYLTGAGVQANAPILTIGRAQVADLFGAFDSGDGVLAIGAAGAFSSRIARLEGDTSQGQIRINGCLLGIGCALSTPSSQFRIQQFRPAAPRAAIDPPVLTPPPPVDDDEREAEAVTTGAGNEEIWRKDPQ